MKEVTYARTKYIKGKPRVYVTRDKTKGVKWLKEKQKEKEEMVFVDNAEIPEKGTRTTSSKWLDLLSKIPLGKAWKISIKDGLYKFGTLKQATARINKTIPDVEQHYRCVQRTIEGEIYVYLSHGEPKQ